MNGSLNGLHIVFTLVVLILLAKSPYDIVLPKPLTEMLQVDTRLVKKTVLWSIWLGFIYWRLIQGLANS